MKFSNHYFKEDENVEKLTSKQPLSWEELVAHKKPEGEDNWVSVELDDLAPDVMKRLWEMYESSYKAIGLNIQVAEGEDVWSKVQKMKGRYQLAFLAQTDTDPKPDTFVIYKSTPTGNKIALLGTDGTKAAKSELIKYVVEILKKPGTWVEASHKFADILQAKGVPVLDKEDDVNWSLQADDIIGGKEVHYKPVRWKDNAGNYERDLRGVGWVDKRIFGTPDLSKMPKDWKPKTEEELDNA